MRGILRILFFVALAYFILSAVKAVAQGFWPHAMERRKRLTRIDPPLDRHRPKGSPPTDQN